jgi:predicted DNA-binding transcriptional regulator YafY
MALQVSYTPDLTVWIRGWGPDCEVPAPEGLRKQIAEKMRRAGEVYVAG